MFDRHANFYKRAMSDESGYTYKIKYTPQPDQIPTKKRKERYPNIFWFNPPYNMAVVTRV